jgi:hypothetical protein
LIRDNDGKFGSCFARVATTSAIELLKTPVHGPRANAVCERFLGSVRQECLDHLLIFHERQLQCVLKAYVAYFNQARPQSKAREALVKRGIEVGGITDFKTVKYAEFRDPDGNLWLLQEFLPEVRQPRQSFYKG